MDTDKHGLENNKIKEFFICENLCESVV